VREIECGKKRLRLSNPFLHSLDVTWSRTCLYTKIFNPPTTHFSNNLNDKIIHYNVCHPFWANPFGRNPAIQHPAQVVSCYAQECKILCMSLTREMLGGEMGRHAPRACPPPSPAHRCVQQSVCVCHSSYVCVRVCGRTVCVEYVLEKGV